MLGQSSNIGARSTTLAWGWPLRLRHPQGRSCASYMTFRDYCNKRNSPNLSLGQRKSAGALPAYIHDNVIGMMAIIGNAWARAKKRILIASVPFFLCHGWLSLLIIRSTIALACRLLASCPTIFQASFSSSRFCGCALADGEACGAMPRRLPSVVGTGSV